MQASIWLPDFRKLVELGGSCFVKSKAAQPHAEAPSLIETLSQRQLPDGAAPGQEGFVGPNGIRRQPDQPLARSNTIRVSGNDRARSSARIADERQTHRTASRARQNSKALPKLRIKKQTRSPFDEIRHQVLIGIPCRDARIPRKRPLPTAIRLVPAALFPRVRSAEDDTTRARLATFRSPRSPQPIVKLDPPRGETPQAALSVHRSAIDADGSIDVCPDPISASRSSKVTGTGAIPDDGASTMARSDRSPLIWSESQSGLAPANIEVAWVVMAPTSPSKR